MRICPQCRLITADEPTCRECGWNLARARSAGPPLSARHADALEYLVIFTAVLFGAGLLAAFSTRRGDQFMPAVSAGLFVAGVIADFFLVWLIHRTATLLNEARRWMMGAVLTFPFGTLVFAWVLARRVRLDRQNPRPS